MNNNRISRLFGSKKRILSVFVTAGFPNLEDTVPICEELEKNGVGMIELGIPFSDSIADGPTIQNANEIALKNGASLEWTLEALRIIRKTVKIPIILMGSLNPILQYGEERFCRDAAVAGADGVIFPDLPLEFYLENYRELFERHGLANIFLITQNTAELRIRQIDSVSNGFIYAVSMLGVTGNNLKIDVERREYLERLRNLDLQTPVMVGFGIETSHQFREINAYADGVIIGSAFLKAIDGATDVKLAVRNFIYRFA